MGCDMSRESDDPNELPSMGPRPPTVANNQQNQNPSQSQVQTREAKPDDVPQGPVVTREQKIEITEEKQNAQENPSEDSESESESESDNTDATDEDKNTKPAKQAKESDEENESSGDEDDKDTESSGDEDDESDDE